MILIIAAALVFLIIAGRKAATEKDWLVALIAVLGVVLWVLVLVGVVELHIG